MNSPDSFYPIQQANAALQAEIIRLRAELDAAMGELEQLQAKYAELAICCAARGTQLATAREEKLALLLLAKELILELQTKCSDVIHTTQLTEVLNALAAISGKGVLPE